MSNIVEELVRELGERQVLTDPGLLAGYTRDYWPLLVVGEARGSLEPSPLPRAVVMPRGEEDLERTVEILYKHRVPIVVYNGGSGVLGGALPQDREWIVVDPGRLDWMEWYDESSGLVWAGAGVHMESLEKWLNERDYTLRHYPQSMVMARLGGLVATASIGAYSTGYGGIEDRLKGLNVAVPGIGLVRVKPVPRRSVLWSLTSLFTGSEGLLGVISSAYLEALPIPECSVPFTNVYPSFSDAMNAARLLVQKRAAPELLRVFDEAETSLYFNTGGSMLLGYYEGPCETVEARLEAYKRITGMSPGDSGPAVRWFKKRTHVIDRVYNLYKQGLGFDTIEVSATWSSIPRLHREVIEGLASIDGVLYASVHVGHFYPSGAGLYYTVVYELGKLPRVYYEAWERVMDTTLRHGGSISHHHGLGNYRLRWLDRELGPEGLELVRRIKEAVDGKCIMRDSILCRRTG